MCGILWVHSKRERNVVKPLLKRYKQQASRGKEGYGYLTIKDGYVMEVKRTEEEEDIIKLLTQEESDSILFHHRLPTSVPNYRGGTHPLEIKHDSLKFNYYVIHNGVISNDEALYKDYKEAGFKFLTEMKEAKYHEFVNTGEWYEFDPTFTFNDSEAFAIDLARYLEGQQTYIRSNGSISFIALQTQKDGKVVRLLYGHNEGNPLFMEDDKTITVLRSIGGGKFVPIDTIFSVDWETGETTEKKVPIGYYSSYKKAGYRTVYDEDWDGYPRTLPIAKEKSDLDRTLEKMLPASEIERKVLTVADTKQMLLDFRQNFEEGELPTILMDDLGFSEQMLLDEISAAEASGDDTSHGVLRQLKDDLVELISKENDKILEYNAALDLLRSEISRGATLEDIEDVKSLMTAAEAQLKAVRKDRRSVEAELGAWVSFSPMDE